MTSAKTQKFSLKKKTGRSRAKTPAKISYRIVWADGVFECAALTMEIAIALFRADHSEEIEQFWLVGGLGNWVEVPIAEIEEERRFEEREAQSPLVRVCCKCQKVREAAVSTPVVRYGIPTTLYTCEGCSGVQIPRVKVRALKMPAIAPKVMTMKAIADTGKTVHQIVIDAFGLGVSTHRTVNDAIAHQWGAYLEPQRLSNALRALVKADILEDVGRVGMGKGYQLNQKKGAGK